MNLSGRAVQALLNRYHLSPAELLVACDDMDLSCGAIRLRASGSAGGHRGVQSIIDLLGTREFARLRIGIGHPPEGEDTVKYVLSRPLPFDQHQRWDEVLDLAADAARAWVSAGLDAAMNRFNQKPDAGSRKPDKKPS
jgi:PTH1 family peptidyl-tRNA hydrolase